MNHRDYRSLGGFRLRSRSWSGFFRTSRKDNPFFIFFRRPDFDYKLHALALAVLNAVTMYGIPLGHIIQLAESQCGHSTVRLAKTVSMLVDPVT
jgi:hypothetical protein